MEDVLEVKPRSPVGIGTTSLHRGAVVKRDDVHELHYIVPIDNVPSVLQQGILSHTGAARLQARSVAHPAVQDLREHKSVPGGMRLHDYANLYLHARNPMLFLRKDLHQELCVLLLDGAVLEMQGVIVTDMNAARKIARFFTVDAGLAALDRDLVFAEDWRHPGDAVAYDRHKAIKCAEVLVPGLVPPEHIRGALVSCQPAENALRQVAPHLHIDVNPHFFFLQP